MSEFITLYYQSYWGDGNGYDGIRVDGYLCVYIYDKDGQVVNRSTTLIICAAPYKIVISNAPRRLTSPHGILNSCLFPNSRVTYYISPKTASTLCYARLFLVWGQEILLTLLISGIPRKGFSVQSTNYATYSCNFPATEVNNLYFDLEI